jgi:hypothetical protein
LFEGYDNCGILITREKIERDSVETQIEGILAAPTVEYIHIRNAEAGCFVARIENR